MSAGIPFPSDKLALVDLDGTLVDAAYRVTDPEIYDAVQNAQRAGWQVGLSSDTPYEALTRWCDSFGMNGPIVAEKGGVVEIDGIPRYDLDVEAAFRVSRLAIEGALRQSGAEVWLGNPVEALLEGRAFDAAEVVLVNVLRQCSLGLFARRALPDGGLAIDNDLTDRVVELARGLYPDIEELVEDINPDYGILITSLAVNTKRRGTQKLMAALGLEQVAMIGNSMGDFLGSDIAVHYAVGDATADFKAQADYVAERPVTTGVVQILNGLAEVC